MLGIESIDKQHTNLLEMIEDIGTLIKKSLKYDTYDAIMSIINELEKYTIDHFSYEEQLMLNLKYNKMFSHREKHRFFVKQIKNIDSTDIDESQYDFLVSLFDFLSMWLINHIDNDDREFAKWHEEVTNARD